MLDRFSVYIHFPTLLKIVRTTYSRQAIHPRHAILTCAFLFMFIVLRCIVSLVRMLDLVFFPGYRNQPIIAPIYIVGNPRSGTTFSHRLLAQDDQFTYFKLWHTIFPAVTFYKVFGFCSIVDRWVGRPFSRAMNWVSGKGFRGWESIHQTGPAAAESDEMLFMYAMLSPLLGLMFPFFRELDVAMFVDHLPEKNKRKLMVYYRDCLQRHLYATGPERILLQKVALIAGRIQTIYETFPDMRIVHLVRHPYESIPSLVSMFQVPWKSLAPQALTDTRRSRELAQIIYAYYRSLLVMKQRLPDSQFIEVRYEDLVADPKRTVERIYQEYGLELSLKFNDSLDKEVERAKAYQSRHAYSLDDCGLTRDEVREALADVFEAYGFRP